MIPSQYPSRFPLCCVGYAFRYTFFHDASQVTLSTVLSVMFSVTLSVTFP